MYPRLSLYLFSLNPSCSLIIALVNLSRPPPPNKNPCCAASASLASVKPGIALVAIVSNGTTNAPPSLLLATYSVPCPIKSGLLPSSDTGYPD